MVKEYIPKKMDRNLFNTQPDFDYITFGNQIFGGKLLSRIEQRKIDGVPYTFVIFQPSDELKWLYRIENSELGSNGEIGVWYPTNFIKTMEFDPLGRRTLIYCSFDKEETELMKLIKGRLYHDEINMREKDALKLKVIELSKELKKTKKELKKEWFEEGRDWKNIIEVKRRTDSQGLPEELT